MAVASKLPIRRCLSNLASSNHLARRLTQTRPCTTTINTTETETLFAQIRTKQLVNTLAILQALSVESLVDVGSKLMQSESIQANRVARNLMMGAVEKTVYRHFCAGADKEEVGRTLSGLSDLGLKGILDYGSEDTEDEFGCQKNLEGFLKMVELRDEAEGSSISFACVKITAICPISLLERMSDILRWEKKDPSFDVSWKSHGIPILSNSSPLYQTSHKPELLTSEEELELQKALNRLSTLCKRCKQAKLPVLIDAEYTSVQPAIDYFTYTAALEFNQGDHPIVYATIQAYLKDSKERMVQAVEAAEREGFHIGLKLVRGAYLTRETQLANSLGVASPIHDSIQDTHACYDECASFMLEKVAKGSGSLVVATHNLESGKAAASIAEELGISKGDKNLQFSQLMGMADGLSFGLRNAGFQVSKYLPYGPVDQVIPYLLRRAEENRGLLSASTLDRELIRKELKRRMSIAVGKV